MAHETPQVGQSQLTSDEQAKIQKLLAHPDVANIIKQVEKQEKNSKED